MGKIEKIEKLAQKGKASKLVSFTRDKDKSVRLAAIAGLSKVVENEDALNTLVGLMEDEDQDIRKAVVTALGESKGSYVETKLSYCLSHEKDPQVLEAAREALKKVRK